jgi:hypothetical protein
MLDKTESTPIFRLPLTPYKKDVFPALRATSTTRSGPCTTGSTCRTHKIDTRNTQLKIYAFFTL